MSRPALTDLGRELVRFFDDFLPGQRGLSPHTIRSYRDTLVLWLQFTAREARRGVELLTIRDLTEERVARFLRHLETDRKNAIATRNARLGSLHVFARFLAARHPEQLGTLQRVIGLPFKHGARDAPIEYLERAEMEALLKSIDRSTALGRRDYALFALMFNTGARVQEVLNLRRRFLPNLHTQRFWLETEKRWVTLRLTTNGMRTVEKKGIDKVVAELRAQGRKL